MHRRAAVAPPAALSVEPARRMPSSAWPSSTRQCRWQQQGAEQQGMACPALCRPTPWALAVQGCATFASRLPPRARERQGDMAANPPTCSTCGLGLACKSSGVALPGSPLRYQRRDSRAIRVDPFHQLLGSSYGASRSATCDARKSGSFDPYFFALYRPDSALASISVTSAMMMARSAG